ncbi:hypothetical protein EV702DRAFT_1044909 [Suillus placidus]|uniref:Uncharacterized protein n=1 Tax=Suillus placidus TaxID=48579 RepID=A0A9P6ZX76_9AGAM|nr:hypothetical protein EV702DRAFT_1044909 [Suillus placidus]
MRFEVDIELIVRNDELNGVVNMENSTQGGQATTQRLSSTFVMVKGSVDQVLVYKPNSHSTTEVFSFSPSACAKQDARAQASQDHDLVKLKALIEQALHEHLSEPFGFLTWTQLSFLRYGFNIIWHGEARQTDVIIHVYQLWDIPEVTPQLGEVLSRQKGGITALGSRSLIMPTHTGFQGSNRHESSKCLMALLVCRVREQVVKIHTVKWHSLPRTSFVKLPLSLTLTLCFDLDPCITPDNNEDKEDIGRRLRSLKDEIMHFLGPGYDRGTSALPKKLER